MIKNKGLIIGIVFLVIVTAAITFLGTSALFIGMDYIKPSYNISFDQDEVSLENIKKFNNVKNILKYQYYEDVDENTMLEGAISGMAYSLQDPYTVYFNKEQMAMFTERTEGSYVGIGVSVEMDTDGLLTIIEPFKNSPAKEVGMMKGDKIIRVDGEDVSGLRDSNLIIKKIKGEENTQVRITAYRPSVGTTVEFDITRKKINIENIESELLPGNIGYIKIIQFDEDVDNTFNTHLTNLKEQGIKSLIIDVRDNPGGDYYEVVKLVDRIIPEGIIVSTRDKNGNEKEEKSDKAELDLPLVLLVNGNSASASEILAGAVKDHNKGTLVGTRTFGKGLVQTILPFEDGSGLKVTIAKYFTPSGICIQGIGIQPDIEVELDEKYENTPASQVPRDDDTQLQKALELLS